MRLWVFRFLDPEAKDIVHQAVHFALNTSLILYLSHMTIKVNDLSKLERQNISKKYQNAILQALKPACGDQNETIYLYAHDKFDLN